MLDIFQKNVCVDKNDVSKILLGVNFKSKDKTAQEHTEAFKNPL